MQDEWERPRWADWVTRLGAAILATPDAVLVAHSSSCALVARWAASAAGAGRVRGALLGAPSDPKRFSYPTGPTGFAPMPLSREAAHLLLRCCQRHQNRRWCGRAQRPTDVCVMI